MSDPTQQLFTWEEIRTHVSIEQGAWIVAHGVVYDVTQFLKDGKHPAGSQCIARCLGQDATQSFDFHSQHTQTNMWHRYRIGRLQGAAAVAGSCTVQ